MTRKNLTDRRLQALKPAPEGKTYDVPDGLVPGLAVRVSEKGRKTFVLIARFPGSKNPTRRALGVYDALPLDAARDKARTWLALIGRGLDPAIEIEREKARQVKRARNTVEAVFDDWSKEKLARERKGAEVGRDFKNNFLTSWAKRPITDITEEDVLLIVRAKKRTAPAQARNLLGHARRFFQWAVDQRVYGLTANPCIHLRPSKIVGEKRTGSRVLSDDELFALWRNAARLPRPFGDVYRLLMLTALRLNEAADISWPEINGDVARAIRNRKDDEAIDWSAFSAEQLAWVIPADRMKGREGKARPHAVPLTADILAIFEKAPIYKRGQHLFSTTFGETPVWMSDKIKKRLDARMLRTFQALARKRGDDPKTVTLPHWTNHDIRRTVRGHLSRLKIAEEAREAVLAHARPGIKGVYDHYDYFVEKREALELWAARLRTITTPPPNNVVPIVAARSVS